MNLINRLLQTTNQSMNGSINFSENILQLTKNYFMRFNKHWYELQRQNEK